MAPDRSTDAAVANSAVQRLEFDVEWPPGHAAAYLLTDPVPTLVDAGMPGPDNEEALQSQLAAAGYGMDDIVNLLITHPHLDHVGLAPELREAGNPTIYAPDTYREIATRPRSRIEERIRREARHAGISTDHVDRVVSRALDRHDQIRRCLPPDIVDVWVAGEDRFDVAGRTFEAVFTPGHQRDHLCFETVLGDDRVAFSGDMGIRPFRAAAVHANFDPAQREAVTAYYQALDRLDDRSVDRVYPGHGPVHEAFDAAVAEARKGLDRLCQRTREAVRPDGTHAIHAAMARTEEFTDGPYIPEAIGALGHLAHEGHLEASIREGVRYYVPA